MLRSRDNKCRKVKLDPGYRRLRTASESYPQQWLVGRQGVRALMVIL